MERYQSLGLYSSTLSLVMTHQDIANYLRMTASTISRILNEFQKKKMIRFSKHRIELQKIDALRLIAEAGDTEAI
ncbi:MAG: hypothetical protein ACD_42C00356G0002 [uncultured bacterium]|nr:MAG: hypothetical protein ACD_42C00356G0002 [uncultured bacterium]